MDIRHKILNETSAESRYTLKVAEYGVKNQKFTEEWFQDLLKWTLEGRLNVIGSVLKAVKLQGHEALVCKAGLEAFDITAELGVD